MSHHHGATNSDMMSHHDGNAFCQGLGTVMLPGFQFSFAPTELAESSSCVTWLFSSWVVDTSTKYAFAVLGTYFLSVAFELLRYERQCLVQGRSRVAILRNSERMLLRDTANALSYLVQVAIAYAIMLLAMLYEGMFFLAIITGLATGYFVVLRLQRRPKTDEEDLSEVVKDTSDSDASEDNNMKDFTCTGNTPCCAA